MIPVGTRVFPSRSTKVVNEKCSRKAVEYTKTPKRDLPNRLTESLCRSLHARVSHALPCFPLKRYRDEQHDLQYDFLGGSDEPRTELNTRFNLGVPVFPRRLCLWRHSHLEA